jgi:hypothetical protein
VIGARGVWFVDVLDAVGKFSQSLIDIANVPGPYGKLFVILFLVGATGVITQMTALVRAIRNRSRSSEGSDEDVSDPTADLATALSKLAEALLANTNTLAPILKSLVEQGQQTEAQIAGVRGEQMSIKQEVSASTTGLQDALRSMTVALEQMINRAASTETADAAVASRNQAVIAINAHTAETVRPVLEHAVAQSVVLGALDTNVRAVSTKFDALPPVLDALHVKVDGLPKIVVEAYATLTAERDDLRKAVAQSVSDLMARDQTIEAQRNDITRLTRERDDALAVAATLKAAQSPDVQPEKSAETDLVKPEV